MYIESICLFVPVFVQQRDQFYLKFISYARSTDHGEPTRERENVQKEEKMKITFAIARHELDFSTVDQRI